MERFIQQMRSYFRIVILALVGLLLASCANESKPATPLETLQAYTRAIKRKDTTEMKLLLSDASIKMAEQEAKAQNRPLDDIVKNETLFSQTQSQLRFRNQKIEGDKATIEVENSFGTWDTVPFVKEEGAWKLDKQGVADKMLEQIEQDDKRLDDIINQGRQP